MANRIRRNIFTGELEEVPYELENGRAVIARESGPSDETRTGSAWSRPHRSTSLAIHPSQVEAFNEAAKAAGTGAYYDKNGTMVSESRGILNRELARRGYGNADAGYGDRPPGG